MHWNLITVPSFFLCLQFLSYSYIGNCQVPMFIRQCNSLPVGVTGDDYCSLVCGTGSTPTCNANGLCQCDFPCGTPAPTPLFSPQLCPPPTSFPQDDPSAPAQCTAACPQVCSGGRGQICGGSVTVLVPDTYLTICSCYCPQPCPTTTTPTTTTSILILPIPNPLVKIKKKILATLVPHKLVWIFILGVKLIGLTLIKVAAFCYLYFGHGMEMKIMQSLSEVGYE